MSLSPAAPSPELPYLEAFHAVCTEGGFTAAARRLNRSQPAISYHVRALEDALKTQLIERGGRRVLLTPAGERLKAFSEQLFGALARVRAECAGDHRAAPLRLGSASGFGRYVLVPALRELMPHPKGPPLQLQLMFDSEPVLVRRLQRGDFDAAFVYTRRVSNRLRYRPVYDEELVLIAAPSFARRYPAAGLESASAFEHAPFVTYMEGDYVFGRWFDANFGQQPGPLRSAAHISELEEVLEYVRRGAGFSIVPRDAAEELLLRGKVESVYPGQRVPCVNQVFVVTRSGSGTRPDLQRLIAALRSRPRQSMGRRAEAR